MVSGTGETVKLRSVLSFGLLVMCVACVSRVTCHALDKRYVTLHDLKQFAQVQSMDLSPDGRMLAYTVNWDHPMLWLIDTRVGSAPRDLGPGQFPRWSPDGKYLAYYSRQSGALQLWIYTVASDDARRVTSMEGGIDPDPMTMFIGMDGWLGDPLRYSWSPDSSQLVFPSRMTKESMQEPVVNAQNSRDRSEAPDWSPLVLTNHTPPQWTLAGIFKSGGFDLPRKWVDGKVDDNAAHDAVPVTEDHLFIVNIHTKAIRRLTTDGAGYFSPDWSPDGRRVLCLSGEGRALLGWGSGPTNLYTIDVATGSKLAITTDSVYKRVPSWSPDGTFLSYLGANGDHLGRVYLFVLSTTGGEPVNISAKLDRRVKDAYWLSDGVSIAINYWDGVDSPIAYLDALTGDSTIVSGPDSAARNSLCVSRSGALAWTQSDGSSPARIFLLQHHNPKLVIDLVPELKHLWLGAQEVVHWKNRAGDDREGVLIEPVGYEKGRRYPLIVDGYPKLQNSFKASPMMPGQAWASRGYAVFYPNADGPHVWENPWKAIAGESKAKGSRGIDVAVDDVVSGAEELVRRGIVDPDRMCLYGFSNGGAIVNQVVSRTTRFRCAVSVAAALSADWATPFFLHTQAKGVIDLVGTTPWSNPQEYIDLSVIYHLDKVRTPILLADGDDDGSFLLGEIEIYNGLRYLGKDVTLLRYPNQGHGFDGDAMKDFWERENAFFDKYLSPSQVTTDR